MSGDEISDGDDLVNFLLGHAGIDEEIRDFDVFVLFVCGHDVNWLGAHDTDDVLAAMDDDSLRSQCFRVESADGIEADEALVVHVGDDETDLVHVGGGHGFLGGRSPFFQGDDISHVVHADLVGEALELGEHEIADFLFKSGRAGRFTNAGKERDVDGHGAREISDEDAADELEI